jgi:uncharacterized protein YuzB (UPF0349 family)
MGATGKFIHCSKDATTGAIALAAAYNPALRHTIKLNSGVQIASQQNQRLYMSGVHIQLNNLGGGAATVTFNLSADPAGDVIIVPDTACTITTGITTATLGLGSALVDVDYVLGEMGCTDNTLYLHAKINAGTANMTLSAITWEE